MKIQYYEKDIENKIIAGITLADDGEPEKGNMALHTSLSADDVLANRNKLANTLGCDTEDFICPNQTHSSNFYKATIDDKGRGALELSTAIADTDAVFTFEPNILLCCFTADCVPVIFHNEADGLVGVIHSGWQGTVKEITLKVFKHLVESEGCNPDGFKVYVGKAISQEKFEVDSDVYHLFKDFEYAKPYIDYNMETHKYHIDNKKIVKEQCIMSGIPEEQITLDLTCTYSDPDCFSYRRHKNDGRHMSFIIRRER